MKITELEILRVPPSWVWLRIHTDTELTGLGEPHLENHSETVITEVKRLEPLLIGKDPCRVEELWHLMYGEGYVGGPIKMSAISGIDIALWDLAGKAAGLPIHKMLGGACHDRIRMYHATGGGLPWCVEPGQPYRAGRPPENSLIPDSPEAYREAARVLTEEWGFRCLKVHFGPGDDLPITSQVEAFGEKFAAVCEGAGPDADVAVDIHNPHPAIAKQLIEVLTPHRPLFVEEPMPVERVDVLAQITQNATVWMGKWIFFDALSRGALSVLQPDICHAGGITECRKIATMGEAAYAKLALHCPLSPLALAASIQLDACTPNFLVQEHNEVNDTRDGSRTLIGKGYFKEPFVLDDEGCVPVPEGPGLGVSLDEGGMEQIMAMPWSLQRG
ncbi:galactonate dehydratase [Candidatus Poribacteria bacterium]|nr:galactonate dehydratase [Candidatus Poribacteria bacterium]